MKYFETCKVIKNQLMSKDVYDMVIETKDIGQDATPGQFLEVFVNNYKNILPRPISICDVDRDRNLLRMVYQVKGDGTKVLSTLKQGDTVQVIGSIGNGFSIQNNDRIAIVGGGVGVPPLLWLTKKLVETCAGAEIHIFLGFRELPFLEKEFQMIKSGYNDVQVHLATDSGLVGFKGQVVEMMEQTGIHFDMVYACGPKPMLQAVTQFSIQQDCVCETSIEKRMACGVGACVGCVVKVKSGDKEIYQKVCKSGPVFNGKEVIWDA